MFDWVIPFVIQLEKFFNYYDPGRPHQRAAIQRLQEDLPPELLDWKSEWVQIWKAGGRVTPFKVPYFNQMDLPNGERQCFTTAMAIVAAFHGVIETQEEYMRVRAKYGDTTEVSAHLKALEELGLRPQFVTNATADELEAEADAGRLTAVGWLSDGDISTGRPPMGFGHWSVVLGYKPTSAKRPGFWMHDPRGRYDLQKGDLVDPDGGEMVFYDREDFLFRWSPEGPGHGWAILVDPLPPRIIP